MAATNTTPGRYGVKVLHSAATFYRKRYLAHRETMGRKDAILKATAETAARFDGDDMLAKTAAVYVHKGTLHGEWRVG